MTNTWQSGGTLVAAAFDAEMQGFDPDEATPADAASAGEPDSVKEASIANDRAAVVVFPQNRLVRGPSHLPGEA